MCAMTSQSFRDHAAVRTPSFVAFHCGRPHQSWRESRIRLPGYGVRCWHQRIFTIRWMTPSSDGTYSSCGISRGAEAGLLPGCSEVPISISKHTNVMEGRPCELTPHTIKANAASWAIRFIINLGANMNALPTELEGLTALGTVAIHGKLDKAGLLAANGTDVNVSFYNTCRAHQEEKVASYIRCRRVVRSTRHTWHSSSSLMWL